MHCLQSSYRWDAYLVHGDLRGYAIEHLGDADGVLVVDETSWASQDEGSGWTWCSAGDGAKGPRMYDWTAVEIRRLREPGRGC